LAAFFDGIDAPVATSRIATVEVARAATVANASPEARAEAQRVLDGCLLVDVSPELLESAARLASRELRTLDAIHLATAHSLAVDGIITYDHRLTEAAQAERFVVHAP
jgi:predicted nucleic acid-binding protein